MNNKIKAAVAGAVLASASVANAGITWDAGEWTVDMNGNVNAFAIINDSLIHEDVSCWRLGKRIKVTTIQRLLLTQVFYHHG